MSNFVKVASLSEIVPGKGKTCTIQGKEVGVYNIDGKIYAMENNCFHQGAPLADGRLEGTIVTCPWHSWKYDVTNGRCTRDESVFMKIYPVKIEGEDIFVQM